MKMHKLWIIVTSWLTNLLARKLFCENKMKTETNCKSSRITWNRTTSLILYLKGKKSVFMNIFSMNIHDLFTEGDLRHGCKVLKVHSIFFHIASWSLPTREPLPFCLQLIFSCLLSHLETICYAWLKSILRKYYLNWELFKLSS